MSLKKSGRISSEEKRIEKIDDVLGLSVGEKVSTFYLDKFLKVFRLGFK